MKKLLFSALVLSLAFTSCKKDDDGGEAGGGCQTCTQSAGGVNISSEYCDNNDGTYTVTILGQSATQSLGSLTFAEFIAAQETSGASCN